MFRRQRGIVADFAQQLNGSSRLKRVSVLCCHLTMKDGFIILKMEAVNPERGDIRIDEFWPAHETQQNIRCDIVTERNGQSQKLAQGDINPGIGILLLQRTVNVGQDTVLRKKPYWLIERKRAPLNLMQNYDGERQLEDRLHRRLRVWIEVAIQC